MCSLSVLLSQSRVRRVKLRVEKQEANKVRENKNLVAEEESQENTSLMCPLNVMHGILNNICLVNILVHFMFSYDIL